MMRTLRDKKTMHIVLWILIFAFVVGFVFIAVGTKYQSFNQRDPNLAAQVGNEKITLDQINQIYEPALNHLYSASGQNPSQEEINQLRQGILDQLVDTSILNQTAQKLHITVSTEEVASVIQRQPYFMGSDGKFDKDRYFQILQANQITPEVYEQGERQDILTQKISSLLNDTVLYSPQDVRHYAELLNRSLKADYVALKIEKYEQDIHPDEDALKSYYESNKSQFDRPERAKSRHILLTLPAGATPAQDQAVSETLAKYRQEILSGKTTFAKIAKEYSQDPGSKDQGGELGWATRGAMVKEFEDQIFDKLKKGQISEPFKTQFGYHIVQLEDYEKAYHSSFHGVRDQVLKKYRAEQALQQITALAQQLALKLQQKESLAKAAAELKLKVDTTPWFTRKSGVPGIPDSKDLTQALAALYVDQWKGPLPLGDNHYFFQITQTQAHSLSDSEFNELQPLAEAQLTQARQDEWEKAFLESQKKKLKVKSYLDDTASSR